LRLSTSALSEFAQNPAHLRGDVCDQLLLVLAESLPDSNVTVSICDDQTWFVDGCIS